jgi:hypothetical protein
MESYPIDLQKPTARKKRSPWLLVTHPSSLFRHLEPQTCFSSSLSLADGLGSREVMQHHSRDGNRFHLELWQCGLKLAIAKATKSATQEN